MMLSAQFLCSDSYSHAYGEEYRDHKDEVNCLAFSPDLEMMVTGGDEGRVRVFNRQKGHLVTRLIKGCGAIKSVAVSDDSRFIASASMDGQVHVWRTCDAELLFKMSGHASGVETVSLSHDAMHLCSGGWDCTAIVWNLETGTIHRIFTGHTKVILCCAFSPNSTFVATGSWDHDIRLWNYGSSGSHALHRALKGHNAAVKSVVFSKQGMLASCSHDKTILLWNSRSSVLIQRLEVHTGWVRGLSFNLSGTVLASVSDDETCRLWDVLTGDCAKTIMLDQSIGQPLCVMFGADDRLVVGGANTLQCRSGETVDTSPKDTT